MVKLSTSQRSPLSPTRWPPDAFAWPRTLIALVVLAGAFFLGLVIDSLVTVALGTNPRGLAAHPKLTWGVAIGQYVSYLPLVAALLVVLPWLARRSLAELGLRLPDARTIGAGVMGAAVMYLVTIGVAGAQYAYTHQKPEEAAVQLFSSTSDPLLLGAFGLLAAIAAPFVEELTFRGFFFNAFLRYLPAWAAAVLSGAIFGLSHGSPTALLPLACSGVVLAYVYYLSGSLTASMITHALFNIINVLLLAAGQS